MNAFYWWRNKAIKIKKPTNKKYVFGGKNNEKVSIPFVEGY